MSWQSFFSWSPRSSWSHARPRSFRAARRWEPRHRLRLSGPTTAIRRCGPNWASLPSSPVGARSLVTPSPHLEPFRARTNHPHTPPPIRSIPVTPVDPRHTRPDHSPHARILKRVFGCVSSLRCGTPRCLLCVATGGEPLATPLASRAIIMANESPRCGDHARHRPRCLCDDNGRHASTKHEPRADTTAVRHGPGSSALWP